MHTQQSIIPSEYRPKIEIGIKDRTYMPANRDICIIYIYRERERGWSGAGSIFNRIKIFHRKRTTWWDAGKLVMHAFLSYRCKRARSLPSPKTKKSYQGTRTWLGDQQGHWPNACTNHSATAPIIPQQRRRCFRTVCLPKISTTKAPSWLRKQ